MIKQTGRPTTLNIPAPMPAPPVEAPVTTKANKREYRLPPEVVKHLGKENLDKLVMNILQTVARRKNKPKHSGMAGFASGGFVAVNADGSPVKENYSGDGLLSRGIRKVAEHFTGDSPGAEPMFDTKGLYDTITQWNQNNSTRDLSEPGGSTPPAIKAPMPGGIRTAATRGMNLGASYGTPQTPFQPARENTKPSITTGLRALQEPAPTRFDTFDENRTSGSNNGMGYVQALDDSGKPIRGQRYDLARDSHGNAVELKNGKQISNLGATTTQQKSYAQMADESNAQAIEGARQLQKEKAAHDSNLIKAKAQHEDNTYRKQVFNNTLARYDWSGISPPAAQEYATIIAKTAGRDYTTIVDPSGTHPDSIVHGSVAPHIQEILRKNPTAKEYVRLMNETKSKIGENAWFTTGIKNTARLRLIHQAREDLFNG